MSLIRFIFHRLIRDPHPGEVWRSCYGDPFGNNDIIITAVKNGWCQYRHGKYSQTYTKQLQSLKAFWRRIPTPLKP